MPRKSSFPVQISHLKLGSIATFVIALFSAPGFVSWIQDGDTKAEVAYEVLQAEVDFLKDSNNHLLQEIRTVRTTMIQFHLRSSAYPSYPPNPGYGGGGAGMDVGGPTLPSVGELSYDMDVPSEEEGDVPEEVEGSTEDVEKSPKLMSLEELLREPAGMKQRPDLPDSLDALM